MSTPRKSQALKAALSEPVRTPRRGAPTAIKAVPENAPRERDAARERILDIAQELFAERGFDGVSVRELAQAAEVNLAAINYYFGSKDGLLLVLFRREAKVLTERRLVLLKEALADGGSREDRLAKWVRALIEPVLRWCLQPEVRTLYMPTLLRAATHDQPELRAMTEREAQDLQPFAMGLQQMLPELTTEEIYWRLHFVLGLEHALIGDLPRLQQMSGGLCDLSAMERIIERAVNFALGGLLRAL